MGSFEKMVVAASIADIVRDLRVNPGRQEKPDHRVSLGRQEKPDLRVNPDRQEKLDHRVNLGRQVPLIQEMFCFI